MKRQFRCVAGCSGVLGSDSIVVAARRALAQWRFHPYVLNRKAPILRCRDLRSLPNISVWPDGVVRDLGYRFSGFDNVICSATHCHRPSRKTQVSMNRS